MQNDERETPRRVNIHYTQDFRDWLPGFVEKAAEMTGKKHPELFVDAFCEVWGREFPDLADRYGKMKKLKEGV